MEWIDRHLECESVFRLTRIFNYVINGFDTFLAYKHILKFFNPEKDK